MGVFNTKATLDASPALIPAIADRICKVFTDDGFEFKRDDLISGGVDISVTKGGIFKAIFGLKTALKITLVPQNNAISFDAGVGIFGQQAVPTVILLMTMAWPVLVTQIWGLIQQSNLDDKALAAAEAVIAENRGSSYMGHCDPTAGGNSVASAFCTNCGTILPPGARFCSTCGTPIN